MILFDLETEGLDPFENAVRLYGFIDTDNGEIEVKTANRESRERDLIGNLILLLLETPEWGGWNITEFDLSFIAVRAHLHGLNFPVKPVSNEPFIGKYGKPRVEVPQRNIHDLAYEVGSKIATERGVQWSLQPVAESLGWKADRPNFREGRDWENTPITDIAQHCIDDLNAMVYVIEHAAR